MAIQNRPLSVYCNTDWTSQLPLEIWHDLIANGTLADAILDRLVHNAYKEESMRKWYAKNDDLDIMEKVVRGTIASLQKVAVFPGAHWCYAS